MDIMKSIPLKSQEEINPVKKGDYLKNGLLYCGVCGKPKQYHLKLQFIDRIVPAICDCQKKAIEEEKQQIAAEAKKIAIQRLKESSMMASKFYSASFLGYQITDGNAHAHKVALSYVHNFGAMQKQNQGLIFYGSVGTGKSYTAACIANALLEKQVSVVMTSFVKVLQDIQSNSFDEGHILRVLNDASLLVLDDLGAERSTDYALEKVYNVIDSRVRANRPMILTTNLTMGEMTNPQDIRYSRIYDRIFECCYPVEVTGQSFRKAAAAARFEEMRKLME
jgi:hypothetical protein